MRPAAPPSVLQAQLARRSPQLRKGAGTVLTLLVHLGLLWVFATRLSGPAAQGEAKPPPGTGMVNLTLAPPTPAAPAAARVAAAPVAPVNRVDATAPSELPPPEWTVATIKAPAAAAAAAPAAFAAAQTTGNGSGGGVYDPFAGAAPLRRNGDLVRDATVGGLVVVGDESGLRLNEKIFEGLRLALARAHPSLRGTVNLKLRVSAAGHVIDATATGGNLAASLGREAATAFVGKHLFIGDAPGALDVMLRVAI